MNHQELIERSHRQAVDKGFWVKPLTFDMAMALIISEIAEALEAYRKGRVNPDWNDTQAVKDSFEVEIADAIIRIYDWCGGIKIFPDLDVPAHYLYDGNEGKNFMILFEAINYTWDVVSNDSNKSNYCFGYLLNTLLSYCKFKKIEIEKYVKWKLDYNLNREYLHGKKF